MKSLILGAFAALTLSMPLASAADAAPARAPAEPQASIPFVNYGGIRDWQATDSRTLYVRDNHNRWYRADMFGPCINLPWAVGIGFETRGIDTFDRFSSVRVGRESCPVSSLTASGPPPSKHARG